MPRNASLAVIWTARNDAMWNDIRQQTVSVGRKALDGLEQWNDVRVQTNSPLNGRVTSEQRNAAWEIPACGWL
jgi:hypothetical protein